ncbi:hypothetical protein V6N13_057268 [Hibiscus sabdariffa]
MLKGKALIKETDMPEKMQTQAMDSASQALDLYDVSDCISIAAHIKKKKKRKIAARLLLIVLWQLANSSIRNGV